LCLGLAQDVDDQRFKLRGNCATVLEVRFFHVFQNRHTQIAQIFVQPVSGHFQFFKHRNFLIVPADKYRPVIKYYHNWNRQMDGLSRSILFPDIIFLWIEYAKMFGTITQYCGLLPRRRFVTFHRFQFPLDTVVVFVRRLLDFVQYDLGIVADIIDVVFAKLARARCLQ